MDERRFANFFEVVELVDKILPPKSEVDYTKISVSDLIKIFDSIIESSGFYFKEEDLESARRAIRDNQRIIEGKQSVFVGNYPGKGFDQNNYLVQNYLSKMKYSIIRTLGYTNDLIVPGRIISTRLLGSVAELSPRMTKEKITDYVRSVLTTSWEQGDSIRIEEYALASDILLHFGIRTEREYFGESLLTELTSEISRMEISSRDFYGPISREGYYDSSTTNEVRYPKALEETIEKISEKIYMALKSTLERTEKYDERLTKIFKDRPVHQIDPDKTLDADAAISIEPPRRPTIESLLDSATVEERPSEEPTKPADEVPLDSLEALKAKYDEQQALLKRNMEIEEKLIKARLEREKIEREIEELEREKQANDEKIKKGL